MASSSSSARTVVTATAIVVGAAYLFYRSIPTLMTVVTKLQMNPPDDEIGQLYNNNDITYEELAALGVIKGKSALIVGGTRGAGFGTSMALAQAGAARVTLVGRNEVNGNKAVSKIKKSLSSSSASSSSSTKVTFLQGDIGTVASTQLFLKKLQHESDDDDDDAILYDYLIVTAAIFPQPKKRNPKPLNEDGVEKSFGIGVVGRFLLYHKAHTFMKQQQQPTEGNNNSPIILNVCASGGTLPRKFNRELVRSLGYSHMFNIINFAIGNELMLRKLVEEDNYDGKKFDIPVITTHPGFLKTDLHRGQGILMDIAEGVLVHFLESTEEECGRRQISILCALANNDKLRRNRRSFLSMVDNFGQGRLINRNTEQDLNEHGNWLWNLLLLMETGCKINDASFVA
jgi:NAD(P)-dependent dehydrogenase (short-subunit alcohol dehydrogenase family)